MKQENILLPGNETDVFQTPNLHRRKFLSKMGLAAAAITGLAACTKTMNSDNAVVSESIDNASLSGYSDVDILNYAYLLEQLEAAFYINVNKHLYFGASEIEKKRLEQIGDHEIAHREFFKTALGKSANPTQQFDFSSIDFSSRTSVLTASKTFEDTGVGAYNGIAHSITSPDYLLVAGKIVSVEARHAAYIRDLLDPLSFADKTVVDLNGLDVSYTPRNVMKAISPFLKMTSDMKSFPYNI